MEKGAGDTFIIDTVPAPIMYLPKSYGESKIATCPFCSRGAYSKNSQGIPVCSDHTGNTIENVKCACGSWLDLREGKWGPFFICEKCGPINFTKALTMKREADRQAQMGVATVAATEGWKTQTPKQYPYIPSKNLAGHNEGAGAAKEKIGSQWKAKRNELNKDEWGNEIFIRSDDPRYEFK
jgi:hypothetical protein